MGSRVPAIVAAAVVGVAFLAGGGAVARAGALAASVRGHVWGAAEEVPGTAALNQGGNAEVSSVSCASAGNCSAGGSYTDNSGNFQAFVVSQTGGTWQPAIEVPGTAALNQGGFAELDSLSCASAGNCSAGGVYAATPGDLEAFVVSQVGGTWQPAIEVPGSAALNQGGSADITSVSCASAGNCSAGGRYWDSSDNNQVFVVSEVGGTWHKAIEVPGTAALNQGASAFLTSVSCGSAGNCSAGGSYFDSSHDRQAFVVSEAGGTWHTAIEVPGSAALNQGGQAEISSVSCASAGNCSAGGHYFDSSIRQEAFVVSEAGGTWQAAIEVPGTAALNKGGVAGVASVSCASAGNCSAGGHYSDSSYPHFQAYVVSQAGGTWHTAIEVPGSAALNKGRSAGISSVSCASAGNCSAGGLYRDSSGHRQALVVSQAGGTWHTAIEVPGSAALNQGGNAGIPSVSCGSAGNCSAGGHYTDSSGHSQALVASET
jgi:hypothetical protein